MPEIPHKKKVMYLITLAAFCLLFCFYIWDASSTNRQNTIERLAENIALSESRVQRNIEFQAKDLQLICNEYGLSNIASIEEGLALLHNIPAMQQEYLVGGDGLLQGDGPLAGKRIDHAQLQLARAQGYGVMGLLDLSSDTQYIVLVIPHPSLPNAFVARCYTGQEFLSASADNLALSTDYICIFDEWGNLAGSLSGDLLSPDASIVQGVEQGANQYNPQGDGLQRAGSSTEFNVYFPAPQPAGWFYGTYVNCAPTSATIFNLPISSLIIFLLLFLIIGVMIWLDMVNEKEIKRKIAQISTVDHLTGLTNGTGLAAAMEYYMGHYPMKGYSFVCMDIVSFSRINNMFGYGVGDTVLCTLADVVRDKYLCGARINADTFVFLIKTAEDMVATMERDFQWAIEMKMGPEYLQMLSFKFGIYPIEENKVGFRQVYDGALLALKDAKRQAKQSEVIYDGNLRSTNELHTKIEINMMHALSKEEFLVYVQPQYSLSTNSCQRGETLIRWNSEFMGFLPPDKFIPVFENNGFVVETDFFMLTAAMELLERRQQQGLPLLTLSVNQSKVTITFPNYYERLQATVANFSVPLKYIELEITESTLENDWETIVPLIHSIKKMGFSVAMDDFGSGFSSLNTLRILPIDVLKIDKDFLQESDVSPRCSTIIRNVITMAKELDIQVVCEGVETQQQLDFLRTTGCDIIQGYYYSKPIPMADFVEKYLPDEKES